MIDEQAATEAADPLEAEIAAEINKTSAPLETEPTTPEVTPETQTAEPTAESGSEYVETDNEKVQARINKKHYEMMEARRQAEAAEQRARELEQRLEQMQPQQPQVNTGEPQLSDFDEEDFGFDETARLAAYTNALTDYKVEAQARLMQERQAQAEAQARQNELSQQFEKEVDNYADKNPSYWEDIVNLPLLTQDKLDLVRSQGPKMVHYLAKNPEAAERYASSDFGTAAIQLGQLSGQLNQTQPKPEISKAPPPTETVTGSPSMTKSHEEMSMEELMNTEIAGR